MLPVSVEDLRRLCRALPSYQPEPQRLEQIRADLLLAAALTAHRGGPGRRRRIVTRAAAVLFSSGLGLCGWNMVPVLSSFYAHYVEHRQQSEHRDAACFSIEGSGGTFEAGVYQDQLEWVRVIHGEVQVRGTDGGKVRLQQGQRWQAPRP